MNGASILRTVLAVVVSLCSATANNECIVVAPNVLRLGTNETVVAMVSGQNQQVSISLGNHPSGLDAFFKTNLSVSPGEAATAEVSVAPGNLPQRSLAGGQALVTLAVTCGNLWTRHARLPVSEESGELHFLQTDKPIYHPGSTVNIRSIALTGSLVPSPTPCKVEIRNPQDVVLEENPCRPNGDVMLVYQYTLPRRALLGEWKLVMRYGDEYLQNTSTTFEVQEYVLPRYSVQVVTLESFILPDSHNVTCSVLAKFVNGMTVRGVVWFRFSVKNELGGLEEIGTSTTPKELDQEGKARYVLKMSDVAARLGEKKLAALFGMRARLVVEANVIEEATGIRQSGRSERAVFSNSPFLLSTARSETSFKPGYRFFVMVDVTYVNGEPADKVPVKLTCANNDGSGNSGCPRLGSEGKTNANGAVTFNIPDAGNASFTVKARTAHRMYKEEQQAEAIITFNPYYEKSGKYIVIDRGDPRDEEKKIFDRVLSTAKSQHISAYYVVLSRGRILEAANVDMKSEVHRVGFPVTPQMTPSFRVVAVGFLDGQLATDAVYVNTKPACTEKSTFTMTWKSSSNQALEPGDKVTLELKGKAGTRVGLLGVDKAVYVLRRKDLLTSDKVFQAMKAKDLGRGVDAGTQAEQALQNSGIVVLASRGVFGELDSRHRRKRAAVSDILNVYEDKTLRECCERGLRPDKFLRRCSERVATLNTYLDAGSALYSKECVNAFADCCTHVEDNQAVGRSFSGQTDALGEVFTDLQHEERKDFRETWIFDAVTIEEGPATMYELSMPDSITTWVLSAFSVAPSGGICVHDNVEVPVFKKLFVEVNLPYSVIQNEQIDIPVTVYNYDGNKERTTAQVRVVMLGTQNVCSGAKEGKPSTVHTLDVPMGQGRTVMFPVVPLAPGDLEISVAAISDQGARDAAKVILKVKAPGVPKQENFTVILDPVGSGRSRRAHHAVDKQVGYTEIIAPGEHTVEIPQPFRQPKEVIPGSQRCEIDIVGSAIGAAVETSVKDPENLLKLPNGCGEQTMSKMAPTLYAYQYLSTVRRISPKDATRALDFIQKGYQNIQEFRKPDGSFSIFPRRKSSLWLTAFVVRTLCEARNLVRIDESVIKSGLQYILRQQKPDGMFHDIFHLYDKQLLGGVQGPLALTAYTLTTLVECSKDGTHVTGLQASSALATAFIEERLPSETDHHVLALAAYALSLDNSSAKHSALARLKGNLTTGETGGLYVPAENDLLEVLATSYALMALLNSGESKSTINGLVTWLNLRMNPSGMLKSSQDTVVALQALSKYAIYAQDDNIDMTCEVTQVEPMENGQETPVFNHTLHIKRDNALVRNRIMIPNSNLPVSVKVKGNGRAAMYYQSTYVAPVALDSLCEFDMSVDFQKTMLNLSSALDGRLQKGEVSYNMTVCARSLRKNITGMTILDVGLLTGFRAKADDLAKLVAAKVVDRYEDSSRNVIFYLPTIPEDNHVCIDFGLKQEFGVAMLQSASVKVYGYYDPAIKCTKFYPPGNTSPLLKIHCNSSTPGQADVCRCLEGGCPPAKASDIFTKDESGNAVNEATSREYLREYACDYVDFVWIATALEKTHKGGFIYVPLHITKVLKPGTEARKDLIDRTRTVKCRENCKSFNMTTRGQYIVMGMDAKYKEKVDNSEEQYVYVIDSEAMVIPYKTGIEQPKSGRFRPNGKSAAAIWNSVVVWFVDEFSGEATGCFT